MICYFAPNLVVDHDFHIDIYIFVHFIFHLSLSPPRVPLAFPGPFRASQARAKLGHGDQFKGTHVEGTAVDLAGPDPGTGGGFTTKTMVDFLGDSISRNGFP